ncbi:hypothetical protein EC396_09160 [Lutibacter sp. HS1-25]|uniref:hypothetical protein n=1 Tax=Lutibacter sp. HS1-25 TaxID=2485000 RepID=UPI001012280F|nr:hypothetical protein [Lutibacter sp. HS1-25]RXP54540.1 hypothetical protein EC396_09160 [Lutibacter sp. HS1-25]
MKLFVELFINSEKLRDLAPLLLVFIVLILFRNWYNRYKKRSYKRLNVQLNGVLDKLQQENKDCKENLKELKIIEDKFLSKKNEVLQLKQHIEECNQKFKITLSKKDAEIAAQIEKIDHLEKAYKRYVSFKNVEANNTRLGAHFIKNVISQIYEDLEDLQSGYKTFLGIQFKIRKTKHKILPIKALKNIFKLLDYNVSALNKDNISLEEELDHIHLFLELIQYLKPSTKITLNDSLSKSQKHTLRIKPTLFFPFIENALKHGSLNEENSFITIELKENNEKQLCYCLVNSTEQAIACQNKDLGVTNFGLKSLQELLNAYYPKSTLEHKILPNNQYLSELTLSLN